jgi:hypothetical protein
LRGLNYESGGVLITVVVFQIFFASPVVETVAQTFGALRGIFRVGIVHDVEILEAVYRIFKASLDIVFRTPTRAGNNIVCIAGNG